jgi:hypothetical protein
LMDTTEPGARSRGINDVEFALIQWANQCCFTSVELSSTTLADLLTLLFYADPHAAVRTPQRV